MRNHVFCQNINRKKQNPLDRGNFVGGAWDLVEGSQTRKIYNYTTWWFAEIEVEMVIQRRSLLDRKVAVMPLLAAASLLLATFWTHPAASARLRLNAFSCLILGGLLLPLLS